MPVRILLPTPLRPFAGNSESLLLEGRTVADLLAALTEEYPHLRHHLMSEDGQVRSFINVYVNDEDIRFLEQGRTRVGENDVVSIIPSIAGGVDHVGFSPEESLRYHRHLIMPEIGVDGQQKLKRARVLIIGAGGLGSPAGLYLAAAGVGTIGIVDFDVVDVTNLQRQIIHSTRDVGRSKVESAKDQLADINPHVQIETHDVRLTSANAFNILREYDIIVDSTDNFPTRYLVNDASVLLGKTNVYGSIFRFEGQATVFDATRGPCYRCLYPSPPPPGLVPSCAEAGVLGVLPGILGSVQALEAIKLIVGKGESLIGRLWLFDALSLRIREMKIRKDPNCPLCGDRPTISGLIDYEEFCSTSPPVAGTVDAQSDVTPEEVKRRMDSGERLFVLDVREPHEYAIANIGGYLIPLGELPGRIKELDSSREIIVHCQHGMRSAKAVEILRKNGFANARNLAGGIDAWAQRIDRSLRRY